MDNNAEAILRQRLTDTLDNKTLLLFTHRTSLLHLVDRVVVMDAGKVVADGPKADILKALKGGQVGAAKR
jgi:ATP-binding cassette subfamily C protein LapB